MLVMVGVLVVPVVEGVDVDVVLVIDVEVGLSGTVIAVVVVKVVPGVV